MSCDSGAIVDELRDLYRRAAGAEDAQRCMLQLLAAWAEAWLEIHGAAVEESSTIVFEELVEAIADAEGRMP